MGWEDRDYNRAPVPRVTNPLEWIVYGQVPLFRAFRIDVRAHATMIIFIGLVLLLGLGRGSTLVDRVQSMTALFTIVLLHEFGHCFAARWVGGEANLIVMHPLGGLAFAHPPRRPLPTFITVAGGPAVNVVICLVCGIALYSLAQWVPWNPTFTPPDKLRDLENWSLWVTYLFWIYQMSYILLIFNLLPVFPLDGGQLLQSILWPKLGYYKSMMVSCTIGLVGGVLIVAYGLLTANFFISLIGINGIMTCVQMKRQLQANGPIAEEEDGIDYSAAYEQPDRPKRPNVRAQRKLQKLADQERAEQSEIDTILAKVSAQGMHSLTWGEKRALKRATENQRKRDQDRAAARRR
jgi:Zn-dependent protease